MSICVTKRVDRDQLADVVGVAYLPRGTDDLIHFRGAARPKRIVPGATGASIATSTGKAAKGGAMRDLTEIGSLDELAALFEERAKAARESIKPATPNIRIALLREQARIWGEAAAIVRRTIMRPAMRTATRRQTRRSRDEE